MEQDYRRGYLTSIIDRQSVDSIIGTVTLESLCDDLNSQANQALTALQFIVKSIDQAGKSVGTYLVLDTYIAETFYWYAIEAIPRFAMRHQNGLLVDIPDEPASSPFEHGLTEQLACGMVDYWQLICAFEETAGAGGVPPSLSLVEETFYSRLALDHYRITGKIDYMSGRDLALLANMKPRSVYNVIPKEIPEEKLSRSSTGNLLIATDAAENWLKQRRRYKETRIPETKISQNLILEFYDWMM